MCFSCMKEEPGQAVDGRLGFRPQRILRHSTQRHLSVQDHDWSSSHCIHLPASRKAAESSPPPWKEDVPPVPTTVPARPALLTSTSFTEHWEMWPFFRAAPRPTENKKLGS